VPKDATALALPMMTLTEPESGQGMTLMADPFFSAVFGDGEVSWVYPRGVGLEGGREERVLVTAFHAGGPEAALELFYTEVLPDIAPGPSWLRRIAMVDYDYLADGGQGWYRDVNALAGALPTEDRGQVLLCLHGWYDWVGRYCFDARTRRLDPEWTAFGSYTRVSNNTSRLTLEGTSVDVGFAQCRSVPMSLEAVHHQLRHARSRLPSRNVLSPTAHECRRRFG
jgi:hypothetical protein